MPAFPTQFSRGFVGASTPVPPPHLRPEPPAEYFRTPRAPITPQPPKRSWIRAGWSLYFKAIGVGAVALIAYGAINPSHRVLTRDVDGLTYVTSDFDETRTGYQREHFAAGTRVFDTRQGDGACNVETTQRDIFLDGERHTVKGWVIVHGRCDDVVSTVSGN